MTTKDPNGYIKQYRKLLVSPVWRNARATRLFLALLLSARHTAGSWEGVELEAGEVIGTRKGLLALCDADDNPLTERKLRTDIATLIRLEMVRPSKRPVKSPGKARNVTVYKICNWEKYQSEPSKQTTKQATAQTAYNKNVLNKNVLSLDEPREAGETSSRKTPDSEHHRMMELIAAWSWPGIEPTPQDWKIVAQCVGKLRNAKVDEIELKKLMNVYWTDVEPSPNGLAKNVSTLRRMVRNPDYRRRSA